MGVSDPSKVEIVPEDQRPANHGSMPLSGAGRRPWGRVERNRLLLWVGLGFIPPSLLIFGLHLSGGADRSEMTVRHDLPVKAILAFFALLATVVVARVERRPLADYGLPVRQTFGLKFWEGAVWGFAVLSGLLGVLRWGGWFRIDSVDAGRGAFLHWAVGWALVFLGVAFHEELIFRGYWLFTMSRRLGFWKTAWLLSAFFGAAHLGNHGETVIGIAHVFATGLLFCLIIRRTGNLWFAIGYHAAWDWAETFFYGTPDSGLLGVGRFLNTSTHGPAWLTGGSAGPEGSLVSLAALAVCALLIHLRFPRAQYPDYPE